MKFFVYCFTVIILSNLLGIQLMKDDFISFGFVLLLLITFLLRNVIYKVFKLTLIILSVISFFNILSYYSNNQNLVTNKNFRISEKLSKDIVVSSKNIIPKRYLIKNFENIDKVDIGMVLNLNGNIEKSNYYDIGVVGEIIDYTINSYQKDLYSIFIGMKSIIKELFTDNFGVERGNILSSLVFGDTSSLDKEYKNDLKELGIVHILSVSGFHINLIFGILSKILSFLPSIIATFIYLVLTGFKVSGIRAFSMVFIREMSPRVHRNYDGINALCVAGSLILLIRPYEVLRLGFIYSFVSTLGILLFNSKIKDYLYRLPKLLSEPISLIISAQIFIIPVNLIINRKLELGFLLSNIFLVPFYSLLVILSIVFVFFSFIPLFKEITVYLIKIIFDVIDGGIILIKMFTPESIYLINILIIFIVMLYILYFFRKKISFKTFNKLVLILSFVYIGTITMINSSVEVGKYYDKNYVIIRNKDRSYLYLDGNLKNIDQLIDKLGVDKVFTNINNNQDSSIISGVKVEFINKKVVLYVDKKKIEVNNMEDNFKYYSDIYPQKYYFIF
ncbi:ComEC/Rec2 family competence protein [Candidatus Arthromitus sp. SFB-rat-Yit]|uniref:ComEC/Rec2 family competence protein n=1 Tax=Candidatus Arthromitus sp. SFB-rat-Yit TaxID=1041504 RepID=UPI000307F8B4|nr:ComEC/Rec2 family competence protein [Candidatus Arthromitus sp. SFB-rat-Yit]